MKITFTPIGFAHNAIKIRHDMPGGGVKSEIHIDPKYRRALLRINQQTHLWILAYLHKAKNDVLVAKPRKKGSARKGSDPDNRQRGLVVGCQDPTPNTRGVFSIHSPDRPNPIALTKVKLLRRKGLVLYVKGLDIIDGTPILDIKSCK